MKTTKAFIVWLSWRPTISFSNSLLQSYLLVAIVLCPSGINYFFIIKPAPRKFIKTIFNILLSVFVGNFFS